MIRADVSVAPKNAQKPFQKCAASTIASGKSHEHRLSRRFKQLKKEGIFLVVLSALLQIDINREVGTKNRTASYRPTHVRLLSSRRI
jgi:hypothetical protein